MLVIRMQRTGRSGHAQFRIVVQDSRQTPSSGRVIAALGSYDPHSKEVKLDIEKAKFYLASGAHPSDRMASLLKKEGVKLPSWVILRVKNKKVVKNIEKLRKNRPAGELKKDIPKIEAIVAEASAVEPSSTTETAADTVNESVASLAEEIVDKPAVEDKAAEK